MKRLFLCILCLFILPVQAGALKAIVNDTPLFDWDVTMHGRLLKAQQPSVYDTISEDELNKVALNNLIEEVLKIQKGRSANITITESEVDDAIIHLEQQNGMSVGGLKRLLDDTGVPMKTLRDQVYADLMWLKYVRSHSDIVTKQVPEPAIDARLKNIKSDMATPRYTVAEIVVPSLEEAQSLWRTLQSEQVSFSEIARQFSRAKSASAGGYVGIIDENHYGPEIAPVLREMPVGQLSRPLFTDNGYVLLMMIDKKPAIKTDSIIIWELAQGGQKEGASFDAILATKECNSFIQTLKKEGIDSSVQQGWVDPTQLPPELKNLMEDAAINEVVGPVRIPQGQMFFMKCNVKSQRVIPTLQEIRSQLEMEQMELLSRRLLEAEKRASVIEYKE